ncbi:MAG: iron uptake system protein EfeO [Blastococcus sp.]
MRDRRLALLPVAALAALTTACGATDDTTGPLAGTVTVAASDTACDVGDTDLPAGTHRFRVTNGGSRITEFYVYGAGNRVVAEVENIAPGVTRDVLAELPAGSYEAACKPGMTGTGLRTPLTVTGTAAQSGEDRALAAAGARYRTYVRAQTAQLVTRTTAFVAAVKAGDIPTAKALYPEARSSWERIEPVVESFGDLDPLIDGREGDQEPGQDFTGFHRLEQALWQAGDVSDMGPYADRLLTDVRKIAARADDVVLTPLQLATGAKSLLDEIAAGKITGEEDRYSHTDLWDLAGNLDGVGAAVTALRPFLADADPALLAGIDRRFAAVETELGRHRAGTGWTPYDRIDQTRLRALGERVTALTESVSKVASVVAGR